MKQKIGYLLLFIGIFLLAVIPSKKNIPMLPIEDVKGIVLMGDSTIGNCKDETGVSAILEKGVGLPCYNMAIGGTCMASLNTSYRNNYPFDEFSVVHLCETIANRDFRTLKNSAEYLPQKKADLNSVILLLENVNFNKIEYVFLAQGLNDYMAQVPPNSEEEADIYTYEGALEAAISDLQKSNSNIKIVILSPTYNAYLEEVKAGTRELTYSFDEYLKVGERVAKEKNVQFLNMYEILGINEVNAEKYLISDRVHFNDEGRKIYASVLIDYVLKN